MVNSVYAAIIETVDLCARLIHICFRHEPRQIRSEGTAIEVPPPILSPGDFVRVGTICHLSRPCTVGRSSEFTLHSVSWSRRKIFWPLCRNAMYFMSYPRHGVTQSGIWEYPQMSWKECNRMNERLRYLKSASAGRGIHLECMHGRLENEPGW